MKRLCAFVHFRHSLASFFYFPSAASEEVFLEDLNDLFDIASADGLNSMKFEEDKEFMRMQRQKGRKGSMAGIDIATNACIQMFSNAKIIGKLIGP